MLTHRAKTVGFSYKIGIRFGKRTYTTSMKHIDKKTSDRDRVLKNDHTMVALSDNPNKNPPTVFALNANSTKKQAGRYEMNDKNNLSKGVFFILISAFFYSLMSLFVRLAGELPTFQKAFFRNFIAALVGFALLLKSGNLKMQSGSLPSLLARSIAGTVGILCNFYAIDRIPISDASILNKLAPFFAVAFSVFVLKEKASWKDWLFVCVAFTGALLIVKPSEGLASVPAFVGALGGLSAGLAYTFVRKLGQNGERTAYVVFFFSAFSCLVMLPVAVAQYQPMRFSQLGFLLLAGLAASGAQFSVTAAYKYAPAKEISVYDYAQVLFSALWGILFLGQFPNDFWTMAGYVVIIGAAVLKTKVTSCNDTRRDK